MMSGVPKNITSPSFITIISSAFRANSKSCVIVRIVLLKSLLSLIIKSVISFVPSGSNIEVASSKIIMS